MPPGPHLLSDMVVRSPILAGDQGLPDEVMGDAGAPAAGGSGAGFEFGVDPSLDPELAMVRTHPLHVHLLRPPLRMHSRSAASD